MKFWTPPETARPEGRMKMADTAPRPEAVLAYRRTLGEVAESQVVAVAEDILSDAWIAELEQARRDAKAGSDAVLRAEDVARDRLRRAQQGSDLKALARAQARLARAETRRAAELHRMRMLIETVDDELELVCLAGIERAEQLRLDLSRLGDAWVAAYGG
jgi:hypothetical protein